MASSKMFTPICKTIIPNKAMSPENRLPPLINANKNGTSQDINEIGSEYPLHAVNKIDIFLKTDPINAHIPPIYYKHTSKI